MKTPENFLHFWCACCYWWWRGVYIRAKLCILFTALTRKDKEVLQNSTILVFYVFEHSEAIKNKGCWNDLEASLHTHWSAVHLAPNSFCTADYKTTNYVSCLDWVIRTKSEDDMRLMLFPFKHLLQKLNKTALFKAQNSLLSLLFSFLFLILLYLDLESSHFQSYYKRTTCTATRALWQLFGKKLGGTTSSKKLRKTGITISPIMEHPLEFWRGICHWKISSFLNYKDVSIYKINTIKQMVWNALLWKGCAARFCCWVICPTGENQAAPPFSSTTLSL